MGFPVYIARHRACGLPYAAILDNPEHLSHTARVVSGWKRNNDADIERIALAEGELLPEFCECFTKKPRAKATKKAAPRAQQALELR